MDLRDCCAGGERSLYESMRTPDLVVRLSVPLDLAISRNESRVKAGKEDAEFIAIRHKLNSGLTYNASVVENIDTAHELDQCYVCREGAGLVGGTMTARLAVFGFCTHHT